MTVGDLKKSDREFSRRRRRCFGGESKEDVYELPKVVVE